MRIVGENWPNKIFKNKNKMIEQNKKPNQKNNDMFVNIE